MASVTLSNVPDDLLRRLKRSARQHGRSLESEVVACLTRGIEPELPLQSSARLAQIREARNELAGVYLTDREVRSARDEGRP